jgi:hypothetical protein
MAIRLVKDRIFRTELQALAGEAFPPTIKVVADLQRRILGFGGRMHKDIEIMLLADGSQLKDIWGFNLCLDRPWPDVFEFRSNINVRPHDGNMSIQIRDEKICQALVVLAAERIDWDA